MLKELLKVGRLRAALMSLTILVFVFGLAITPIEKQFGQFTMFSTIGDGLWWSITTATGVGYGDYAPVTAPGRVIGAILQVAGVLVFGVVIALVTVELFRNEQIFYWKRTVERFDRLEKQLEKIEKGQQFNLKNSNKQK